MSPEHVQSVVLGWIGAASLIIGALAALAVKVLTAIADVRSQLSDVKSRQDRQGQVQTTLLLNTPAPANASPTSPPSTP